MNLYTYLAESKPREVNNLLKNYGFKKTNNF